MSLINCWAESRISVRIRRDGDAPLERERERERERESASGPDLARVEWAQRKLSSPVGRFNRPANKKSRPLLREIRPTFP